MSSRNVTGRQLNSFTARNQMEVSTAAGLSRAIDPGPTGSVLTIQADGSPGWQTGISVASTGNSFETIGINAAGTAYEANSIRQIIASDARNTVFSAGTRSVMAAAGVADIGALDFSGNNGCFLGSNVNRDNTLISGTNELVAACSIRGDFTTSGDNCAYLGSFVDLNAACTFEGTNIATLGCSLAGTVTSDANCNSLVITASNTTNNMSNVNSQQVFMAGCQTNGTGSFSTCDHSVCLASSIGKPIQSATQAVVLASTQSGSSSSGIVLSGTNALVAAYNSNFGNLTMSGQQNFTIGCEAENSINTTGNESGWIASFCSLGVSGVFSASRSIVAASSISIPNISGTSNAVVGSTGSPTISATNDAIIACSGSLTISHNQAVFMGVDSANAGYTGAGGVVASAADNTVYMDLIEARGTTISSDASLKRSVRRAAFEDETASTACDRFCQVELKEFEYNSKDPNPLGEVGFDADNMAAHFPEAVRTEYRRRYDIVRDPVMEDVVTEDGEVEQVHKKDTEGNLMYGDWYCPGLDIDVGEHGVAPLAAEEITPDADNATKGGDVFRTLPRGHKAIDLMALSHILWGVCKKQQDLIMGLQATVTQAKTREDALEARIAALEAAP